MAAGKHELARRLATALRERREELQLTQERAAERSGVSVRYWRDLEAAKPDVSMGVLDGLLHGLEWSWHDLADRIAPTRPAQSVAPATVDLFDRAWKRATLRERRAVTAQLQVLAGSPPRTT